LTLSQIVDNLEQRAADSIKAEQGDYLLDGLLHCGKCKTPKQVRISVLGRERTPMCLCKCASERRDKEEAERARIKHEQKIAEMRRMGFPDEELRKWTFAQDDHTNERISTVAINYAEKFVEMRKNGKGLLFFGEVGTGKTFAAACIVNALIDRGFPCLMTNFARLTNTIQGMFDGKQEYIDSLNNFDLLVIDDLASERNTEYMNEIVFNIIDSRYRAGLPMIITTNLTAKELKSSTEIAKQRVYSRLLERCIPIEVQGVDRRRKRLQEDFKEYADMLGL
jgi:DNA replication protein DnaC